MRVKVFRFRVSNAASSPCGSSDKKELWFRERMSELISPEQIEDTVNSFLDAVNRVVGIEVNTVDVNYHNNARGNTVDLIYTIMYE